MRLARTIVVSIPMLGMSLASLGLLGGCGDSGGGANAGGQVAPAPEKPDENAEILRKKYAQQAPSK